MFRGCDLAKVLAQHDVCIESLLVGKHVQAHGLGFLSLFSLCDFA